MYNILHQHSCLVVNKVCVCVCVCVLRARGEGVLLSIYLFFYGGGGTHWKYHTTFIYLFCFFTKKLFSVKIAATAVVTHLRDNYNTHLQTNFLYTCTCKLSQTNLMENIHVPFSATHPYAPHSRHHFLFFFAQYAWQVYLEFSEFFVSFLNLQILCVLDSDVFSYQSSKLGVKRGCFSPLSHCVFLFISCLCYVLCSVLTVKLIS